jgi:hypothetical protein
MTVKRNSPKKYVLPEGVAVSHRQLMEAKNYLKHRINETSGPLTLNGRETWVLKQILETLEFDPFERMASAISGDDLMAVGLSTFDSIRPEEEYDPFGHLQNKGEEGSGQGGGDAAYSVNGEDLIPPSVAVVAPDATPNGDQPINDFSFGGDEQGMPLQDLMSQQEPGGGHPGREQERGYGDTPGQVADALQRVLAGESSPMGVYNRKLTEEASRHLPSGQIPSDNTPVAPRSVQSGAPQPRQIQEGLQVLRSLRKGIAKQGEQLRNFAKQRGSTPSTTMMSVLGNDA